uniref:Ig-like domain-containing protein n=1 Tax=Sinocyclocheilus rhinocerous TaxID=307959 RepID=A0A673H2Z6_9TELE
MRTVLRQDNGQNNLSGSQTGLWGKQKPGYHRRGSRRRRPIKKTTTKSPIITVTKIADKPATTKSTTIASQIKHNGAILRSLHTPIKESERSSSPVNTGAGSEGWRDSNMSSTTSFPGVISLTIKPTTASDKPQSRTVTSSTMTSSTSYIFTPFPYSSSTVTIMGTLTIQEVSVLDSGHYKCIASNPAGTDTATVRLQVVAAPPVILEEKQQLVSADIGQNLFLACSTYDPKPQIIWRLPSKALVDQSHR